jgi:hypothetical protein
LKTLAVTGTIKNEVAFPGNERYEPDVEESSDHVKKTGNVIGFSAVPITDDKDHY